MARWRRTRNGVLIDLPLMTNDQRQYQLWIAKVKTREGLPLIVMKASVLKYNAETKTFSRDFIGAVFFDPESFGRMVDALRGLLAK